jgi:hypothetical protein
MQEPGQKGRILTLPRSAGLQPAWDVAWHLDSCEKADYKSALRYFAGAVSRCARRERAHLDAATDSTGIVERRAPPRLEGDFQLKLAETVLGVPGAVRPGKNERRLALLRFPISAFCFLF